MNERCRYSLLVESGDEGFPDSEGREVIRDIIIGSFWEIFTRSLDRFSVMSREGSKGMLYLESELSQDTCGDIDGVLRTEKYPDSFRSDEFDNHFHLLKQ